MEEQKIKRAPYHDKRPEMLMKMYDQLMNDINRHILVVWQSVSVLVGAMAIFALAEKGIIPLDIATSIIILIVGWLLAHLYDAGYWYNRNLVIIANIEKQFLHLSDSKDIHCYFIKHRKDNELIEHLKIQLWFGIGVGAIIILYHYIKQVYPWPFPPYGNFAPMKTIPYIILIICIVMVMRLRNDRIRRYMQFKERSPGIEL